MPPAGVPWASGLRCEENPVMKTRNRKLVALMVTGGCLLQISGCGGVIANLLLNTVITRVAVKAIDTVLGRNTGSSNTTDTTTTP